MKKTRVQKISPKKFIRKLNEILQSQQNQQIISWDQNGFNVIIKNIAKFEEQIIPKHFKLKKISSFVRQLHLYDFRKIKTQDYALIFKNLHFRKNNIQEMAKICRNRFRKRGQFSKDNTQINSSLSKLDSQQNLNQLTQEKHIDHQNLQIQESVDLKDYLQIQQNNSDFLLDWELGVQYVDFYP